MSVEIKFVKPTIELIEAIAEDMRQEDRDEVWASGNQTPIEALTKGMRVSDSVVIAMVDNQPCVMFGLVICDILTGTGNPWLLGTNEALNHKRQFLLQTPYVIDEMLSICPKLYNYVHVNNKISIRWLKWLGFTIDKPMVYGVEKELFHKFHIERV